MIWEVTFSSKNIFWVYDIDFHDIDPCSSPLAQLDHGQEWGDNMQLKNKKVDA